MIGMKKLFLFFSCLVLSGCVGATSYKSDNFLSSSLSLNSAGDGYSHWHLDDIYRVRFAAKSGTSRETLETYWLYRCAELALEKGYKGFDVLSGVDFSESLRLEKLRRQGDIDRYPVKGSQRDPVLEGRVEFWNDGRIPNPPRSFNARELYDTLSPIVHAAQKCDGGNVCVHDRSYLGSR